MPWRHRYQVYATKCDQHGMPVGGTFPLKMEGMELPMTLPECDRRGHTDSPQQFALAEARANAAADALIAEEEAATHQALDKRSRVKSKRRSRKPRPQQSLEPPTTRTESVLSGN